MCLRLIMCPVLEFYFISSAQVEKSFNLRTYFLQKIPHFEPYHYAIITHFRFALSEHARLHGVESGRDQSKWRMFNLAYQPITDRWCSHPGKPHPLPLWSANYRLAHWLILHCINKARYGKRPPPYQFPKVLSTTWSVRYGRVPVYLSRPGVYHVWKSSSVSCMEEFQSISAARGCIRYGRVPVYLSRPGVRQGWKSSSLSQLPGGASGMEEFQSISAARGCVRYGRVPYLRMY